MQVLYQQRRREVSPHYDRTKAKIRHKNILRYMLGAYDSNSQNVYTNILVRHSETLRSIFFVNNLKKLSHLTYSQAVCLKPTEIASSKSSEAKFEANLEHNVARPTGAEHLTFAHIRKLNVFSLVGCCLLAILV